MTMDSLALQENVSFILKKSTLRLEIIAGVHAGAVLSLSDGQWLLVGSDDDCDVILSDEGVLPHHCLFGVFEGKLQIRSLQGVARWGEDHLSPGETHQDFPWGDLHLGKTSIRICSEVKQQRWLTYKSRHYGWIALSFIFSTFATYGMAVSIFGADAEKNTENAINVIDIPNSQRDDEKSASELRDDKDVVSSAKEVLRLSGVVADVQYLESGKIEVSGFFGDGKSIANIVQSRAMREVHGLRQVAVINRSTSPALIGNISAPIHEVSAESKMIKIISGDDAYLVASDGSRYYPGAKLPNGMRLLAVLTKEVIVENVDGEEALLGVENLLDH